MTANNFLKSTGVSGTADNMERQNVKQTTTPLTSAQVAKNHANAVSYLENNPYVSAKSNNPYGAYQDALSGLITQTTGSLEGDLSRIGNRYTEIRNQIMAQYGNTNNQALLNARDLALKELELQAGDASRQVAANYDAAQAKQSAYASRARAIGNELGSQNAAMNNVAAGNINAWNDQFGVTDGASVDLANAISAGAPRAQALAQALGLSAGQFEDAMGTSIGEQKMAIQGQIARDLAARSGSVSTQTAREIAAAEMRDREAQRQAMAELLLGQMQAEEAARASNNQRAFGLQQALVEAGLQGGLFNVEQGRYADEVARQASQDEYQRWLDKENLSRQKALDEWNKNQADVERSDRLKQQQIQNNLDRETLDLNKQKSGVGKSAATTNDLTTGSKIIIGGLTQSSSEEVRSSGSSLLQIALDAKTVGDQASAVLAVNDWFKNEQNKKAVAELKKRGIDQNKVLQNLAV